MRTSNDQGRRLRRLARFVAPALVALATATALPLVAPTEAHAWTTPNTPGLTYTAHVENVGWQNYVDENDTAGTVGQSKRAAAFAIQVTDMPDVQVRCQALSYAYGGWRPAVDDPSQHTPCGSTGSSMRVENLRLSLTGTTGLYTIEFRCHVELQGWTNWTSGGNSCTW